MQFFEQVSQFFEHFKYWKEVIELLVISPLLFVLGWLSKTYKASSSLLQQVGEYKSKVDNLDRLVKNLRKENLKNAQLENEITELKKSTEQLALILDELVSERNK